MTGEDKLHRPVAVPRFARSVGRCLLAVVGLYAVYAVGVFVGVGREEPLPYRLVHIIQIVGFPLPLLVAPATFFAALDSFDLHGEAGSGVRRTHCIQLGLVALCAWLTMHLGLFASDYAVDTFIGPSPGEIPEGRTDVKGRTTVPIAIALFVVIAGIGGAVTGRVTRGLPVGRRHTLRWLLMAALVSCFVVTLVGLGELIAWHGVLSPPWLALTPPAVALAFVGVVARRDCARLVRSLSARFRLRPRDRAQAVEAAVLVNALREVAAPAVEINEPRVRQIVAGLTNTADQPQSRRGRRRRTPGEWEWRGMAGGFASSWACISAGFLVLGGAGLSPPTVVSALSAGLIGAAGSVWRSR